MNGQSLEESLQIPESTDTFAMKSGQFSIEDIQSQETQKIPHQIITDHFYFQNMESLNRRSVKKSNQPLNLNNQNLQQKLQMNQYFYTPRTTTTMIAQINFYNSPMPPGIGINQIAKINLTSNQYNNNNDTQNSNQNGETPVSYRKSVINNARKRQINSNNKNTNNTSGFSSNRTNTPIQNQLNPSYFNGGNQGGNIKQTKDNQISQQVNTSLSNDVNSPSISPLLVHRKLKVNGDKKSLHSHKKSQSRSANKSLENILPQNQLQQKIGKFNDNSEKQTIIAIDNILIKPIETEIQQQEGNSSIIRDHLLLRMSNYYSQSNNVGNHPNIKGNGQIKSTNNIGQFYRKSFGKLSSEYKRSSQNSSGQYDSSSNIYNIKNFQAAVAGNNQRPSNNKVQSINQSIDDINLSRIDASMVSQVNQTQDNIVAQNYDAIKIKSKRVKRQKSKVTAKELKAGKQFDKLIAHYQGLGSQQSELGRFQTTKHTPTMINNQQMTNPNQSIILEDPNSSLLSISKKAINNSIQVNKGNQIVSSEPRFRKNKNQAIQNTNMPPSVNEQILAIDNNQRPTKVSETLADPRRSLIQPKINTSRSIVLQKKQNKEIYISPNQRNRSPLYNFDLTRRPDILQRIEKNQSRNTSIEYNQDTYSSHRQQQMQQQNDPRNTSQLSQYQNNYHEYSNEFLLNQKAKYSQINTNPVYQTSQTPDPYFQRPTTKHQGASQRPEFNPNFQLQLVQQNTNGQQQQQQQQYSHRQHSQIRILKQATKPYEPSPLDEDDWLQKSADVLTNQHQAIGQNHELEQTQFIDFKEINKELQMNNTKESHQQEPYSVIDTIRRDEYIQGLVQNQQQQDFYSNVQKINSQRPQTSQSQRSNKEQTNKQKMVVMKNLKLAMMLLKKSD